MLREVPRPILPVAPVPPVRWGVIPSKVRAERNALFWLIELSAPSNPAARARFREQALILHHYRHADVGKAAKHQTQVRRRFDSIVVGLVSREPSNPRA